MTIGILRAVLFGSLLSGTAVMSGQDVAVTPRSTLTSAVALLGAAGLRSVTLSGNAKSVAGSTEDTGPFTAHCSIDGASNLSLQFAAHPRSENRQESESIPSGYWVDEFGHHHPMASHNLYTPESWFCPAVVLLRVLQTNNVDIEVVGEESKNGRTVAHFTMEALPVGTGPAEKLRVHLSHLDIYIDPSTSRPESLEFNIHPDNDASTDIPVEIRFSGYAQSDGVWFPSEIQQYINNSLALDLTVQTTDFK